jgi:hypothetical protein
MDGARNRSMAHISSGWVIFRLFIHMLIYGQKIFSALGNNRPQILVQLEDFVLQAIVAISEGKPRDPVMDSLHAQVLSLEQDLAKDKDALAWFDLSIAVPVTPSTPPALSKIPSTPFPG